LNHFYFPVSFGTILMSWNSAEQLHRIEWTTNRYIINDRVKLPTHFAELVDSIRGYFYQGEPLGSFPWDRIDQSDWTDFQKQVYQTISLIPHGQTRTYGWVAARLGNRSASRAVGQALRKNPLPILIPCHRVQGCQSTGGFMGTDDPNRQEVQLKRKLISLEEEYESPLFAFLAPEAGRGFFEFAQTH
jgi:methylated-DNA-[protein]-cysteine S-methyltransferase